MMLIRTVGRQDAARRQQQDHDQRSFTDEIARITTGEFRLTYRMGCNSFEQFIDLIRSDISKHE